MHANRARYDLLMDLDWAKHKLEQYITVFDLLGPLDEFEPDDLLRSLPTVRKVLDAIGENSVLVGDYHHYATHRNIKYACLRGLGIIEDWDEVRTKLRPDAPILSADRLHPWVWEAARPSWESGLYRPAVHHGASAVNEQLQRKVGRQDISDDKLVQEVFRDAPATDEARRLRVPGDPTNTTTKSRQRGALQLGLACCFAIRNPAAHETTEWPQQLALERLATLSVFANIIYECNIEG